jgi:threo-3-hydroxy-L-aspartate ammonia-lyase
MKTLLEAIRPTTFIQPIKLSEMLNCDITIASETFQHTGSFKFRAAYNVAVNVENTHIIAASSGNFGQAMAYACLLTGKKCTIVMPETSAKVKIDAVRNYGATADLVDTQKVGRVQRVTQLADEFPDAYIGSAYDDLLVIDGNSTIGDELALKEFDIIIVPVGGGGLISGISLGLCRNGSNSLLLGAEPLLANDATRSLKAGKIIANESEPTTIADGARTLSLGKHNWTIIEKGVSQIIEVSDENICEAVRLLFSEANLKVEPTGALALGAILENSEIYANKRVCLVVSGGNVDTEVYRNILAL